MKRRSVAVIAVFVATIALSLTACSSSGSSGGSPNSSQNQELRIGTGYQVDSLNPFVAVESSSLAVFKYVYPTLVQYNTNLATEPNFATSWSHNASGLEWTFHLHPGAKWSDGQSLTANDVAWTVNTVLKYASGGAAQMATYLQGVKSATAQGNDTVTITLSSPEAAFLANISEFPILPSHVWSKYAAGKNGANLRTFSNTPSSSQPMVAGGPFICTQYQNQGVSLFTVNPNFYGSKPTISGFGLEYFSSPDAMISALKTNQVDAILNAPPSAVTTLQADKNLVVDTKPALNDSSFFINDNPKKKTHRELLNPLVHQAFNYAIDRNAIVANAFNGDARPGEAVLPVADTGWYDSSITPAPFDLAKANALLDQAGYKKGSNGIRIADGHPMSYTVILATDEQGPRTRAFDIIQSDFAKIGVRLTLRVADDATAANLELAPSQKFDLAMWGWTPPVDPSFMLNTYTCGQIGGWSETGWCSKQYDKLFAEQASTIDPAKRQVIVHQMQEMLAKAMPEFIYAYENVNDAWNKNWTGFGETPDGLFSALTIDGIVSAHRV